MIIIVKHTMSYCLLSMIITTIDWCYKHNNNNSKIMSDFCDWHCFFFFIEGIKFIPLRTTGRKHAMELADSAE